jgi:methylenetetrahydrofolate reductase (NADPH)
VGIHWATEQVRDLVDHGVKGVHFYTLNRSKATLRIYETLGLKNVSASNG